MMNVASSILRCSCVRVARDLSALRLSGVLSKQAVKTPYNFSTCGSLAANAKVRIMKRPVRLIPTRVPLVLTPKAVDRVKELLADRPDVAGLRVSVLQRGCSGLTYTLDYVGDAKSKNMLRFGNRIHEEQIGQVQPQASDVEVIQDDVKIYIDRRAQLTLLGTEMDYVETKLGAEFVFSNPNIKSTCGCGESFMLSF